MKTAAIWMIIVLALSVVFSGCSGATVYKGTSAEIDALEPEQTTPDGDAEETVAAQYLLPAYDDAVPSLWETYADAFRVGAAVNTDQLTENSAIYQTITKHYNVFVAENEMKPLYLNPSEGTFYFDAADRFVEFGERVDAALRGHTLVWHSQTPAWWFEGEDGAPATSEQLLERMETYITEVVSRYKGRIQSWDVVNEVISIAVRPARGG